MKRKHHYLAQSAIMAILFITLAGCGTYVPRLEEPWEAAKIDDDLVYRIKKSIYCELRTAIRELGPGHAVNRGRNVDAIPDDWGVQLTLTLTVDEMSSLSPSGTFTRNYKPASDPFSSGGLVAQNFSLPFSAQLSSQATRIDTYYSFFAAKGLKRDYPNDTSCRELDPETLKPKPLDRHGSSYLLSGSLGVRNWLSAALIANDALPSSIMPKANASKLDVLQYNLKFVVVTNGAVNPIWRLAPLAVGVGSSPLLSASRTRTHQLLLTLGPAEISKGKATPGVQANNLNFSGQFEQAVSNGFRSVLQQ